MQKKSFLLITILSFAFFKPLQTAEPERHRHTSDAFEERYKEEEKRREQLRIDSVNALKVAKGKYEAALKNPRHTFSIIYELQNAGSICPAQACNLHLTQLDPKKDEERISIENRGFTINFESRSMQFPFIMAHIFLDEKNNSPLQSIESHKDALAIIATHPFFITKTIRRDALRDFLNLLYRVKIDREGNTGLYTQYQLPKTATEEPNTFELNQNVQQYLLNATQDQKEILTALQNKNVLEKEFVQELVGIMGQGRDKTGILLPETLSKIDLERKERIKKREELDQRLARLRNS